MGYFLVTIASLSVSVLTLFSGFGLGTLLLPVFTLFFPVEVAVAATAVVHGANSIFKICLVGKHAERTLVIRFGVPAMIAALVGATALGYLSHFGEVVRYSLGSQIEVITPLKLVIGVLILIFAFLELFPRALKLQLERKHLMTGGLLSGFFGGLSGHQGAIRAAFLTKVGISTESFVGTNAVISFMVDTARISIYAATFLLARQPSQIGPNQWPLILAGVLAAFTGVIIGRRFLHRVPMKTVQALTGFLLLGIALMLGAGIL